MAQLLFVTSVFCAVYLQLFLVESSQLQVYDQSVELKTCIAHAIRATFKDGQPLYIFFDKYGRDLMPEHFDRTHVISDLTEEPITFDLRNGYNYLVYANDTSSLSSFLRKLPSKDGILGFGKTYTYGTVLLVTSYENVKKIYQAFWEKGVINVVIFMVHQKQVYISSPHYRSNECGTVFKEYLLQNCTYSFEVNFKLLQQFYGCPIHYKKFVPFDSFPNQIADMAVLYLRERFGVKVVANEPKNAITVVFFIRSNMLRNFEESYTLFSDEFAWVAPISEHSTFTLIDRIFEFKVWILIAFAFVASVTAWWCITLFTKTQRTFQLFCKVCLDLFSLTTCGVFHRVPRFRALKVIVLSYLLYSMLIQTGFKANLIKCLTVGTKHRIDTLEKVAASSLPVCIPLILHRVCFSKKREEEELYSAIKKKFINCKSLSCDEIREPCIYLTLKSHLNLLTVDLTEMTITYNSTLTKRPQWKFFVPKGHYMLDPLNRVIESLMESGTYQKMYDEFYSKFPTDIEEEDSEPIALNLDHVRGIFVIYLLGCVLSLIVFGVEVFKHRML